MKLLLCYAMLTAAPFFSPTKFVSRVQGFSQLSTPSHRRSTALAAGEENDDYMRWARQARSAEDGDVVVELPRPLGLVLNADEQGNVYVEKVAPKGNAARTGKVSCQYNGRRLQPSIRSMLFGELEYYSPSFLY